MGIAIREFIDSKPKKAKLYHSRFSGLVLFNSELGSITRGQRPQMITYNCIDEVIQDLIGVELTKELVIKVYETDVISLTNIEYFVEQLQDKYVVDREKWNDNKYLVWIKPKKMTKKAIG